MLRFTRTIPNKFEVLGTILIVFHPLTLRWQRSLLYRHWFLYNRDLRHERVNLGIWPFVITICLNKPLWNEYRFKFFETTWFTWLTWYNQLTNSSLKWFYFCFYFLFLFLFFIYFDQFKLNVSLVPFITWVIFCNS